MGVCTATIDMDELETLNRDRIRLLAAERIWQAQFCGESLLDQIDMLLDNGELDDFVDMLTACNVLGEAHEETPARRI